MSEREARVIGGNRALAVAGVRDTASPCSDATRRERGISDFQRSPHHTP